MSVRGGSREVGAVDGREPDPAAPRASAGDLWPDLFAFFEPGGSLLSVSPPGGWPGHGDRAGAAGGPAWDGLDLPGEVARVVERLRGEVSTTGRPAAAEVCVPTAGAAAQGRGCAAGRVVECRVAPMPDVGLAGAGAVVAVLREVTAAHRAAEALRESEWQYRLLAENSSDMISRHDPSGVYLYVSPASRALVGFEPGALLGRSPYEFIHPDDLAEVHRVHSVMLAATDTFTVAFRGRRREGSYVWLESTTRAVRDPETGRVAEIQCATRDITRRKQVEQELRESRELLQAVLENSPALVYIKDADGRFLLVNRRFEAVTGLSRREAVGRTDGDMLPPDMAEALRANDLKVAEARGPLEFEESVPQEDGPHTFLSVKFPLFDREGAVYAVCGISTDITPRQRAEAALREQSEVLRSILDNMADAVAVADESAELVVFNPAAERMFGTGVLGTTPADWQVRYGLFLPDAVTPFPPDDMPLARAVRGEATNDVEMFVRHDDRPDGAYILINGRPLRDEDGRPRGGVVVCRDITERKSTEQQLRSHNRQLRDYAESERTAHEALKHAEVQLVQAEKLTALGQMVAGVAHEINNPLAFVSNNVAVLQRDVAALRQLLTYYRQTDPVLAAHAPDLLAPVVALAEEMDLPYTLENLDRLTERSREGLRRIQQIVKDLRDFARLDDGDLQAADLNVGVTSTVNIIHGRATKHSVGLTADLRPLPPVTCYPGKINQVVMNLLANAIDACGPGGKVAVRTEPEPGGGGVLIHIEDNGAGIPPGVRARIFDPFFTTKPVGQGTGLGLSISYGIVKAQGGTIAVESEPGKGSRFTVRLPLTPPAVPPPAAGPVP